MMSVPLEIGVFEGRRPLNGLPGLVQLKYTASQRRQVCLIWVKQCGSATQIAPEKVPQYPSGATPQDELSSPD